MIIHLEFPSKNKIVDVLFDKIQENAFKVHKFYKFKLYIGRFDERPVFKHTEEFKDSLNEILDLFPEDESVRHTGNLLRLICRYARSMRTKFADTEHAEYIYTVLEKVKYVLFLCYLIGYGVVLRVVKNERNVVIMDLLERAIKKYNELKKDDYWKDKLLDAPPILWFGNIKSEKPKVVTIGANPSKMEFDPSKRRFRKAIDAWKDLMYKGRCLDEIYSLFEDSYNNYFREDPYRGWFGSEIDKKSNIKDKKVGTLLEAFLNGLGATFYEKKEKEYKYRAEHIDLFPFATSVKFRDLIKNKEYENIVIESMFNKKDCWGQRFMLDLIKLIEPKIIILIGGKNMEFFKTVYNECPYYEVRPIGMEEKLDRWSYQRYDLLSNKNNYAIHAITLYPPNAPVSTKKLNELGRQLLEEFIQEIPKNYWF